MKLLLVTLLIINLYKGQIHYPEPLDFIFGRYNSSDECCQRQLGIKMLQTGQTVLNLYFLQVIMDFVMKLHQTQDWHLSMSFKQKEQDFIIKKEDIFKVKPQIMPLLEERRVQLWFGQPSLMVDYIIRKSVQSLDPLECMFGSKVA